MGFWLLRILIKLVISNIHLANDADERIVLIKTYTAMFDDKYVDQNDRKLILEQLFRHSAIGLLKDDAGTLSIDTLNKILNSSK